MLKVSTSRDGIPPKVTGEKNQKVLEYLRPVFATWYTILLAQGGNGLNVSVVRMMRSIGLDWSV
jgi:hypothetical protein